MTIAYSKKLLRNLKIARSAPRCLAFISLGILFTHCDLIEVGGDESDDTVVARVYDRDLYQSDIDEVFPEGLNENDSAVFVENYINVWAKEQLMLYKAEYNLSAEQKDFDDQIEEYRNDLLKFTYRQEYVRQQLDTTVGDEEIAQYYEEHQDNFLLKENILKARYIVLSVEAPKLRKAKKWFKSSKEKDQEELLDYALSYSSQFLLEDTVWISFEKLISVIPVETYNQRDFLASNRLVEMEDSLNVYMLEIMDYRIKESRSPLSYVNGIIKNIIINKRKLELLENLEKNLLEDAIKKKEFETY